MSRNLRPSQYRVRTRRGAIAVFAAILLVAIIAMIAFALDIGRIVLVRNEMQRSADAAALAGAWQLIDNANSSGNLWSSESISRANDVAVEFVDANPGSSSPVISPNPRNRADGDVVVGRFSFADGSLNTNDPSQYNALRVKIRRTGSSNGEIPMVFARVFGLTSVRMEAEATAYLAHSIAGFRVPTSRPDPLPILPIALDLETWERLMDGNGDQDNWTWNEQSQEIEWGADNRPEVNLYPQDTGSAGNRGTVNIGTSNNSTGFLRRQIASGVTESDLNYHGGQLALDDNGQLQLGGNSGISAAIASSLSQIAGQPRIILIFSSVTGSGNNAVYNLVKFAGVRIMEVQMSGGNKRVMIQPANVVTRGVIPADPNGGTTTGSSEHVFAPPYLVY